MSRRTAVLLGILLLLLVALRIALPTVIRDAVNRKLDALPEYEGKVGDVDLSLYRGAYTIHDIQILKENGQVTVPFFSADKMDLSLQWGELFHGAIVGEVDLTKPSLAYVVGPTPETSQTKVDKNWQKTLEELFPFRINKFHISDGTVRFQNNERQPPIDLSIYNLVATATNLTNVREVATKLPAALDASGKVWGEGQLELHLELNAMSEELDFKLAVALTNVNLVALNDFMRAYAKVDVESGVFSMYAEVAAADGRYEGYIKPFFDQLNVFEWDVDRKENVLSAFWEAIVGTVGAIFENQPEDQLATKIPFAGEFQSTDVDLWATVGNLLRNAFVRALIPRFDRSVTHEKVEEKVQKSSASPSAKPDSEQ